MPLLYSLLCFLLFFLSSIYFITSTIHCYFRYEFEPKNSLSLHNCICTQQRLRSVCANVQTDLSLRCPLEKSLDLWLPAECPVKILFRLHKCKGWSEFSLGTHAILYEMLCLRSLGLHGHVYRRLTCFGD